MSIDEHGFLSDDILECRDHIRQRYAPYFDFIYRVNDFCQQAKFGLDGVSTNDQNLMAAQLIVKLLADTQGAVLLLERGLASQGRTLLRSACETCIILRRVCQDEEFYRVYSMSEQLTGVRWIKEILKDKSPALDEVREEFKRRGIIEKQVLKSEQELKSLGAKRLDIGTMAKDAGLSGLYFSAFKLYCQDTHSSPYILESFSTQNQTGEVEAIMFGPIMENLEDALLMIPRLMISGFCALNGLIDLRLGSEFDRLVEELRKLEQPQNTR